MEKIRKLICFIFGHNFMAIKADNNDQSVWGWFYCSRCGYEEFFQFDK
jgi:predicted nucleic-acid-binding Zn-ribbon protein